MTSHRSLAIPFASLLALATAPGASAQHYLEFRAGPVDPLYGFEVPAGFDAPDGTRCHLLQTEGETIDDDRLAELLDLGVEVTWTLPESAYYVRFDPKVREEVASLPGVRWVGPVTRFHRIDPVVVQDWLDGALKDSDVYEVVMFRPGVDGPAYAAAASAIGAEILDEDLDGCLVATRISPALLPEIAALDQVLYLERAGEIHYDMANARIQTGAKVVQQQDVGLNGIGLAVYNQEEMDATNLNFLATGHRPAPIQLGPSCPTGGPHGTQVAGILASDGANDVETRGMLPEARLYYTHEKIFDPTHTCATSRGRESFTVAAVQSNGLRVMNASWGLGACTVGYETQAAEMDFIAFRTRIFITQSQGNGQSLGCAQSRREALAKNVASVAGFHHFNNAIPCDDISAGMSTGPAGDGRFGVTFTGFSTQVAVTQGHAGWIQGFTGTSASAPMVCGAGGIAVSIFDRYGFGYNDGVILDAPVGKGSTVKALLMSTSEFVRPTSCSGVQLPRTEQGWGFPDVERLFEERDRMLVVDEIEVVPQGGQREYMVFCPGGQRLRFAMTYADYPAAPGMGTAAPTLVNDLDLTVIDPLGQTFHGNQGLAGGYVSTPGGTPDAVNPEEMVAFDNAVRGVYVVRVSAPRIAKDAHLATSAKDADFGLAVCGISGMRDGQGGSPNLVLSPAGPGQVKVRLEFPPPPASYAVGRVLFSAAVDRPHAAGEFFGLERDAMSAAGMLRTPTLGDPQAFLPPTGNQFPTTAAAVSGLPSGTVLDAVAVFWDANGTIVSVSDVERVRVN